MRTVIVILERKFLQMFKEILANVIDNLLADIHHNFAPDCYKKHTHCIDADQCPHKCEQKLHIFIRYCDIQCFLSDHWCHISECASDSTQHDCKQHWFDIFFDIGRSPKQMTNVKWFL